MSELHQDVDVVRMNRVDPLYVPVQNFDFDAVDRSLGFTAENLNEENREQLAAAMLSFVRWICDVSMEPGCENIVGLRAIAAAWVLNPQLFNGASQTRLTKVLGLANKMRLSTHASEFTRLFGVCSRAQSHGWNAKHFSEKRIRNPLIQEPSTNPLPDDTDDTDKFCTEQNGEVEPHHEED